MPVFDIAWLIIKVSLAFILLAFAVGIIYNFFAGLSALIGDSSEIFAGRAKTRERQRVARLQEKLRRDHDRILGHA